MAPLNYQLHYSHKRKTIALQIKQGELIVKAPSYLSKIQVTSFVETKRDWIDKKLHELHQRSLDTSQNSNQYLFNYLHGDSLFVFGEKCILHIQVGEQREVIHSKNKLLVTLTESQYNHSDITTKKNLIKVLIQHWLNEQVKLYITNILPFFEKNMQLYAISIKVRIYKSRWGSCNSKKQLTFNALLAMTPKSVIDYVMIHELSHLKHMNHSDTFWQLVAKHCPNFIESKQWLTNHQKFLYLPD